MELLGSLITAVVSLAGGLIGLEVKRRFNNIALDFGSCIIFLIVPVCLLIALSFAFMFSNHEELGFISVETAAILFGFAATVQN